MLRSNLFASNERSRERTTGTGQQDSVPVSWYYFEEVGNPRVRDQAPVMDGEVGQAIMVEVNPVSAASSDDLMLRCIDYLSFRGLHERQYAYTRCGCGERVESEIAVQGLWKLDVPAGLRGTWHLTNSPHGPRRLSFQYKSLSMAPLVNWRNIVITPPTRCTAHL
jgi:hypothetical protein